MKWSEVDIISSKHINQKQCYHVKFYYLKIWFISLIKLEGLITDKLWLIKILIEKFIKYAWEEKPTDILNVVLFCARMFWAVAKMSL